MRRAFEDVDLSVESSDSDLEVLASQAITNKRRAIEEDLTYEEPPSSSSSDDSDDDFIVCVKTVVSKPVSHPQVGVPSLIIPASEPPPPPSPPPPSPKTISILFIVTIPGKESRSREEWGRRSPFYRKVNSFNEDVVLVYEGKVLKPFMVPAKLVASEVTSMDILVLSKSQYHEILLSDEDAGEQFAALLRGSIGEEGTTPDVPTQDTDFPIRLEGSLGYVRVMVTPETTCGKLVEHYMKTKSCGPVRVRFEGDFQDDEVTVEELDLEPEDMVDMVDVK